MPLDQHTSACPSALTPCCPQLTSLPDDFGALSRLDALSLHKNCLTVLPASLSRLKDLSRLSLYENELTEVPAGIGELTGVQEM
jgi:Leucine-rich repeat (LRR) protein